jgi:23S rRNA (cytidine1920-2'-O)/16S rRNA (cytidine1409-2'-O)-methyltransferase
VRLDVFLTEKGVYASRTRAARAVEEGCVKVNGNVIKKTSFDVSDNDNIETMADPVPFVSRGAFKLKHALECFDIDIHGVTAVDIGASTGGFTEIMLSAGAAKVFAVDVGKNQLAKVLREDERVVSIEETDIRNLPSMGYREYFEFGACDASFISLTSILPSAFEILKKVPRQCF